MSSSQASPRQTRPPGLVSVRSTAFLLVRHAESAANASASFGSQTDSPLTERGRRQAAALTEALAGARIDAVYSSDLIRAKDTVREMTETRNLPLVTDALLRERDMGELSGWTFDAIEREHPELWERMVARDVWLQPPGGESHAMVGGRIQQFLARIIPQHRGHTVVICAHGGSILHLIRQLAGLDDIAVPSWFTVANASVSRVDLAEPRLGFVLPRIVYANRVVPDPGEAFLP